MPTRLPLEGALLVLLRACLHLFPRDPRFGLGRSALIFPVKIEAVSVFSDAGSLYPSDMPLCMVNFGHVGFILILLSSHLQQGHTVRVGDSSVCEHMLPKVRSPAFPVKHASTHACASGNNETTVLLRVVST